MKKSSIFLLSFIALCYLTNVVVSTTPNIPQMQQPQLTNLVQTEKQFPGTEEIVGAPAPSPTPTPTPTPTDSCFYEKIDVMIKKLERVVEAYIKICDLPSKPKLRRLFEFASSISKIIAHRRSEKVSDEVYALGAALNHADLDGDKSGIRQLQDALAKKRNFEDESEKALVSIEDLALTTIKKGHFPFFIYKNIMGLIRAQFSIDELTVFGVKYSCIPTDWEGIKYTEILRVVNEGGFSHDSVSIFEKTETACKTEVDRIKIQTPNFSDKGGIAITWWGKEDRKELKHKKHVILRGYKQNRELIEYSLTAKKGHIDHSLRIGEKNLSFHSKSKCVDYYFVLIAIEPDCDHYKVSVTVKFLASNERHHTQFSLVTESIEGLELHFTKGKLVTNDFYREFKYKPQAELSLMSKGVRQASFLADIKAHAICKKDCEYSRRRECLKCKKPKVTYKGKCYKKCPENTFQNASFQCVECHIKCEVCLTNANPLNKNCDKCKKGLVKNLGICVEKCPPNKAENDKGECVSCSEGDNCARCKNTKECLECKGETFLKKGKCVKNCENKYYKKYNPNICAKCRRGCHVCKNSKGCIFPPTPKHCKKGEHKNHEGKCVKCKEHCYTCLDSHNCKKCREGFHLLKGECVSKCPKNHAEVDGICVECEKHCERCKSSNQKHCIKCDPSYYLLHRKCVPHCGDGYRAHDGRCVKCTDDYCKTCTENRCINCKGKRYLLNNKKCVEECPDGHIHIGKKCVKCTHPHECKKCSEDSLSTCVKCYPGQILYKGKCIEKCPKTTYLSNETCKPCTKGCNKCKNPVTCVKCDKDHLYKNGECVSVCGDGYKQDDRECKECKVKDCKDCNTTRDRCIKCKGLLYLYNNECHKHCPEKTFPTSHHTCEQCSTHCHKCDNAYSCIDCDKNYFLQQSKCVKDCKSGFVPVKKICVECSNRRCKKCDGPKGKCVECSPDKILFEGDCVTHCREGFFQKDRQCHPCRKPCKECKSENKCTTCIEHFHLVGDKCDDHCKPNEHKGEDGKCHKCRDEHCLKCESRAERTCIKCEKDYYLNDRKCVKRCPNGKMPVGQVCEPCIKHCKTCSNLRTCDKCDKDFFLKFKNTKCVKKCGKGYVAVGDKCLKCKGNCKYCKASDQSKCTDCYERHLLDGYDCVTHCKEGDYDDGKKHCKPCADNNCKKCHDHGKDCVECKNNFILQSGKCKPKCDKGFTSSINKKICVECKVKKCETCLIGNLSECIKCEDNHFLLKDKKCVENCPYGYMKNTKTGKCEKCIKKCGICNNHEKCQKCKIGYYLNCHGKCVKHCSKGTRAVNGECVKCSVTHCYDCQDNDKCKKCKRPYLLDKKGKCVLTCEKKHYEYKGKCKECGKYCEKCHDYKRCITCTKGKFMNHKGECEDTCPKNTIERDGRCVHCQTHKDCHKCHHIHLDRCIICHGDKVLKNGKCVERCGEGFYEKHKECHPCSDRCERCHDKYSCLHCEKGFYLFPLTKKCVEKCGLGYRKVDGKCVQCTSSCEKCDKDKCHKCEKKMLIENGKCVSRCSYGYYLAKDKKHCKRCEVEKCDKCINSKKCERCVGKYLIQDGKCVEKCKKGYVDVKGICTKCADKHCEICNTNLVDCIKCFPGTPLYQKRCKPKCLVKTFALNNICVECVKNCDICDNKETCIKCTGNLVLNIKGTKCIPKCEEGEVRVGDECKKCTDTKCKKCKDDVDHCVECHEPKKLFDGKCKDVCPGKTYYSKDDKRCKPCAIQCKTCHDKKSDCIHCDKGFVFKDGKCQPICKKGETLIDGKCVKCLKDHCHHCGRGENTCDKCKKPMVRRGDDCLYKCDDGEYVDDLRECKKCGEGCHECNHHRNCIKCKKDLVLFRGKCQKKCDGGYIPVDQKCVKCYSDKCHTCDVFDTKKCKVCHHRYVLISHKCKRECPKGKTLIEISKNHKICVDCSEHCELCKSKEECLKCKKGTFKKGGKCVVKCEDGEIVDDKHECKKCIPKHCLKCHHENLKRCIYCKEGYFLLKGQCVKHCDKGMRENKIHRKCEECEDTKCIDCKTGVNKCDKCKDKHYIYHGKCVKDCPPKTSPKNFICVECKVKKCRKCDGSKVEECHKCKKGYYLSEDNKECKPYCKVNEFIFEDRRCEKCPENCKKCKHARHCTECKFPFKLKDGDCTDECNKGEVRIDGKCVGCLSKHCYRCHPTDHTSCIKCEPGYYRSGNECVKKCKEDEFPRGDRCVKCHKKCGKCVNGRVDGCIHCHKPRVLQHHRCVKECHIGYEPINGVCKRCANPEKVKRCKDKHPIECKRGFYLDEEKKECVKECREGYFEDEEDKKCVKCEDKDKHDCHKCKNKKDCDKCKGPMVVSINGKCVQKCDFGQIVVNGKCVECKNNKCKTCRPTNLNICVECAKDLIKDLQGNCVPSCEKGTYQDGNECKPCHKYCKECKNEKECIKCKSGFIMPKNSKVCKPKCPRGYTMDDNGKCVVKCTDNVCDICHNTDPSKCYKCQTYTYRHKCWETCPKGTRPNESKKTCVECDPHCEECNASGCIKCYKHFYFGEDNKKKCDKCPKDGRFLIINKTCVKCKPKHCQNCVENDDKKCEKCDHGFVNVDGECKEHCKDGYYKRHDKCYKCEEGCKKCEDKHTCIECEKNLLLYDNKCIDKCKPNTVQVGKKCVKCASKRCEECDSKDQNICKKCFKPNFFYKHQCHQHCPRSTFPQGDHCEKCPEGCEDCEKNHCKRCKEPLKLKNNKCVDKCGDGYRDTGRKCVPCTDSNCDLCPKDEDTCEKCKNNTYLMIKTGKCKPDCGEGYLNDPKTKTCVKCTINCKTCNDKACIVCRKGTFLHFGKCVEKCPIKHMASAGKCVECTDKKCNICSESSADSCIHCEKPYIRIDHKCVEKCPLGTYMKIVGDDAKCEECNKKCKECTSRKNCIKCKKEFTLQNGKCITKCAPGQVKIDKKCVNCADTNCDVCRTEINTCIKCKSPYVLHDRSCRIKCPNGHYVNKLKECKKCDLGCETCPDSEKCHKCLNGYFLNKKHHCVKECPRGEFGDCNINVCRKCNEACEECIDETSNNCARCHKGFYINENACVDKKGCRKGTYADDFSRSCAKCSIKYCSECSSKSKCTACVRGYELNEKGQCSEAKSFISVIGEKPQLFSIESHRLSHRYSEKKYFSADLKGVAVQSNSVNLSFYFRVIAGNKAKSATNIFRIVSTDNGLFFKLDIVNGVCRLTIGEAKYDINSCSDERLRDFALFSFAINKDKSKGTVATTFVDSNGTKEIFNHNFHLSESEDLINRDSAIEFNHRDEGSSSDAIFEVAQFIACDFKPTEAELAKLSSKKPVLCDYNCSECKGTCVKCPTKGFPVNGSCAPHFVSITSGINKVTRDHVTYLRRKLNHRLDSTQYAVATWFYLSKSFSNEDIISLTYSSKNIISLKVVNGAVRVIVNKNTINVPVAKATISKGKWYFAVISVINGNTEVTIRDLSGLKFFQTFVKANNLLVLTEDAEVRVSEGKSIYNARVYVNNVPSAQNIQGIYDSLKFPSHCVECNSELACKKCSDGKVLSKQNTCEEPHDVRPHQLFEKITSDNEEFTVNLPSAFNSKSYTIALNFRFKYHQSVNGNNIFTFVLDNGKKVVGIKTGVPSPTDSVYQAFPTSKSLGHTFKVAFNKPTDWVSAVFIFDEKTVSVHLSGSGIAPITFSGLVTGRVKSIIIGSNASQGNFFESALGKLYPSKLSDSLISAIKNPVDCDPACLDCNYINGKCNKCITGNQKGKHCDTYLYGYKSAYLYGVQHVEKGLEKSYSLHYSQEFKKDVNSKVYSVVGYFRVLDTEEFKKHTKSLYNIFTLSDTPDVLSGPAKNLISLEIDANGGSPVYRFRISSLLSGDSIISVNLAVEALEWVKILATVDISGTVPELNYWIVSGKQSIDGKQPLPSSFSRLTNKGVFSLLGIGINVPSGLYRKASVQFESFYSSPNLKGSISILQKFISAFHISSDPKIKNCALSLKDTQQDENICLKCASGFEKKGNKCHEHKNLKYHILLDESVLVNNHASYSVPSAYTSHSSYTLVFHLKSQIFVEANTEVLSFGSFNIVHSFHSNGHANLKFSQGSKSTITFNDFNKNTDKDLSWYTVISVFDNKKSTITIIVLDSAKKQVYKNTLTGTSKISADRVVFNDGQGKVLVGNAYIAGGDHETSAFAAPSVGQLDALIVRNNKPLICQYGSSKKGYCKSQPITEGPVYSPHKTYFNKQLGSFKHFSSNTYTVKFSFESSKSIEGKTLLSVHNDKFENLRVVFSHSGLFVQVSNRHYQSTQGSAHGFKTKAFNGKLENEAYHVTIVVRSNSIHVVVVNSLTSILDDKVSIKGVNENINENSVFTILPDVQGSLVINIKINYDHSLCEIKTRSSALKRLIPRAVGCVSNGLSGCVKCVEGRKLSKGKCLENSSSVVVLNHKVEVYSKKPYETTIAKFADGLEKFGVSFHFKPHSFFCTATEFIVASYKLVKNGVTSDFIDITIKNGELHAKLFKGTSQIAQAVITKFDSHNLGWINIRVSIDNSRTNQASLQLVVRSELEKNNRINTAVSKVSLGHNFNSDYKLKARFGAPSNKANGFTLHNLVYYSGSYTENTNDLDDEVPQLYHRHLEKCVSTKEGHCNLGTKSVKCSDSRHNDKLFRRFGDSLGGEVGTPSWEDYVVSFDADLNACIANNQQPNGKLLFNIHNKFDDDHLKLTTKDIIGDVTKYGALTVRLTKTGLRFVAGSNGDKKFVSFYNFFLGDSLKAIKNIKVQVFVKSSKNQLIINIQADNLKYTTGPIKLLYKPESLRADSLFFSNPLVRNIKFRVRDPRLGVEGGVFSTNTSNDSHSKLCGTKNNFKTCTLGESDSTLFGNECNTNYSLIGGVCEKKNGN